MTHASLHGYTVLELGGFVATPFAAHLLAELGADVIKIEPFTGDPIRTMANGEPSGTFFAYSRGKKSVCLNLSTAKGYEVFERLLAKADIVVHNLAPGSARRLRLTHADCHRINPAVVYAHVVGYGPGPLQDELASNPIIEAATGVMFGHRINGRPTRLGPSYQDQFAGAYAVIGILAALTSKEAKLHRHVEIGLYETGLHVAAKDLVGVQMRAPQAPGAVQEGEFSKPGYGAYQTADDRWIYLLMLTDNHWARFCQAMDIPPEQVAHLTTVAGRKKCRGEVEERVAQVVAALPFDTVAARLRAVDFGHTEVKSPERVLSDPQTLHPGKLQTSQYQGREFKSPRFPGASLTSTSVELPPPVLGEHTAEILSSLGYAQSEQDEMLAAGAIRLPK